MIKIAEIITAEYYKKEMIAYLKYKLSTDKRWCLRALEVIFDKQTEEEKRDNVTKSFNRMGFTSFDAEILTNICLFYLKNGFISNKQLAICLKVMPKYAKQLLNYTNINDLERIMDRDNNYQEKRKEIEKNIDEKNQKQLEQLLFNF